MLKRLVLIFFIYSVTLLGNTLRVSAQSSLAPTPPMGWNSWNKFGCKIDESLMRETADAFVSSGMRDAGYKYLNIDECWMAKARDGT